MKDIQRLTGRLAALSHFLVRSGNRCLPFFKMLKGTKKTRYLSGLRSMKKRSKNFKSCKKAQTLFPSTPHRDTLRSTLREILHRPDASSRLTKWAVELTKFSLEYGKRKAIKGQVLPDFVVEMAQAPLLMQNKNLMQIDKWILMNDGSSTSMGTSESCILIPPKRELLKYSQVLIFLAMNNEADYEALITRLMIAKGAGVEKVLVKCDSQLIVNQVKGEYELLEDKMKTYANRARELLTSFKKAHIKSIRRHDNTLTDSFKYDSLSKRTVAAPSAAEFIQSGVMPSDSKEAKRIRALTPQYIVMD
ncbi:hypothetical protein CRG98_026059 [Punica granatum]|uniref:RNase H type-1 domain-containing protein n=1 Tax=Punica granatum TaxID=22663 RepID=A0A2I0JBA7_PUNGR|nr:hypothetical protein CRG98_026059 [Punica granatum]